MIPAEAVPVATPVVPKQVVMQPPSKVVKPQRNLDDRDRPVTPEELQEANAALRLDDKIAQKIKELREDILQGRVKATEPRKIELGFLPESKVQITIPKMNNKIKTKFTKEQYEKYLEAARRLEEQKQKRLADAIRDVIKETT